MVADGNALGVQELLELWRESGDPAARDRLVMDHLSLVRRLCRRFYRLGEPMDDLVQVGTIGLIKAIKKYDPERGNNFVSFAVPVIVGEIKNYFRDHGWAVKLPRKLQQQKLAVDRSVITLTQSLGRAPTVSDIAQHTGFSHDEVTRPSRRSGTVSPCPWTPSTTETTAKTRPPSWTTWEMSTRNWKDLWTSWT